ncbi:unnamed protein product [Alopecurus aequalis]
MECISQGEKDQKEIPSEIIEEKIKEYLLKDMYDGAKVACYDQLRLTKRNFHDLCAMLREKCGLCDSVYVAVEEKVAMFLLVVGHGLKMRLLRGQYKRSLWTISSHFSKVLKAILCLHREFIKLPDPSVQPPNNYKWKWFPDALGALDGCHIDDCVNVADQGRYRNRKQAITSNMIGVVDWNMKFLYVLPGWEGSASDSRVLRDAMRISRQDAFDVPDGKYYLGDAGYTNGPGFLTPFRSTRYHLKEWASSGQQPKTEEGLYNLRHSRDRNCVERTFGLLKKRFDILRTASFFDIEDQIQIISACCVLHNYARDSQYMMDDLLLEEANEKAPIYKNKVIHNWNEICTIYSKDHATGQGARTCAENEVEVAPTTTTQEANDISPDLVGPSPKRPRMGEAIMCMLGDVKTSFSDSMNSTEPQGTPPSVIHAALEEIPNLSRAEKLRGYAELVHSERSYHALLELPMEYRKVWLMMLV